MSAQVDLIDRDGGVLTAKRHAIVTSAVVNGMGIYHGCEATIAPPNTIHLDAGWATIYGRLIEVQEQTFNVTLPSSGTLRGRLYCVVDLANTNNMCDIVVETGSTLPALPDDPDMNYTTGKSAFEICNFIVGVSQISNLKYTAPNKAVSYASIDDFRNIVDANNDSGYFSLPGGLHVEFGKTNVTATSKNKASANVTWKKTFTSPPAVTTSIYHTYDAAAEYSETAKSKDVTTTGATLTVHNMQGGFNVGWTRAVSYIAVGK